MPHVDRFELTARNLRRRLRSLPLLEPVANRAGMWMWRRHLAQLARQHGVELPAEVTLVPDRVHRAVPRGALPREARQQAPRAAETAGAWEREVRPLAAAAPGERSTAPPPAGGAEVAFDARGRTCLVVGSAADEERLWAARDAGTTLAARVVLRHPRWARTARQVMAYAHQRGGSAYQPYLHPDLAGVPSDQGDERFAPLLAALPVASGTLLDLGANGGYFSHRFEETGFDCVAVERSEKEAYFLAALRDALERRFVVRKGSLTEVELPPAQVALALNIFHHFLKAESSYQELLAFLRRLDTHHLLFEPHLPDDPQMRTAARPLAPDDFARLVAGTAGLARVERLGEAADGRPLYLLSRSEAP